MLLRGRIERFVNILNLGIRKPHLWLFALKVIIYNKFLSAMVAGKMSLLFNRHVISCNIIAFSTIGAFCFFIFSYFI